MFDQENVTPMSTPLLPKEAFISSCPRTIAVPGHERRHSRSRFNSQFISRRRTLSINFCTPPLDLQGRANSLPSPHARPLKWADLDSDESVIIPITNTKIYKRLLSNVYIPDILGLKRPPEDKKDVYLSESPSTSALDRVMKPGGYNTSVFNLLNATLGAGSVTVPFAASRCGLIPFYLINIFLLLASTKTVCYLCQAVDESGSRSFETLSLAMGGLTLGIISMIMMIAFCFGTAVGYIKTVGGILARFKTSALYLHERWMGRSGSDLSTTIQKAVDNSTMSKNAFVVGICLFCLLPLSMRSNLNEMRMTSLMGFVSICVMVIMVAINAWSHGLADDLRHEDGTPHWWRIAFGEGDLISTIQSLGLLMFSYNCHANVPTIYAELEHRDSNRMKSVSRAGLGLCLIIYVCAGTFGFLTYGGNTKGNILENSPNAGDVVEVLGNVLCMIALTMTVIFAYPMNIFPIVYSLKASYKLYLGEDLVQQEISELENPTFIDDREEPNMERAGVVAAVSTVLLTLFVALNVESVEQVFGVVGAVTGSAVALVLPSLYYITMVKKGPKVLPMIFCILGCGLGTLGFLQGLNVL